MASTPRVKLDLSKIAAVRMITLPGPKYRYVAEMKDGSEVILRKSATRPYLSAFTYGETGEWTFGQNPNSDWVRLLGPVHKFHITNKIIEDKGVHGLDQLIKPREEGKDEFWSGLGSDLKDFAAEPKSRKESKAEVKATVRASNLCLCGCRTSCAKYFAPGHDAKVKSIITRNLSAGRDNLIGWSLGLSPAARAYALTHWADKMGLTKVQK